MRVWRTSRSCSLALLMSTSLMAQEPSSATPVKPYGRYQWGPLYLTPRFRFGPIGLDTNVYYTPTDRQPDVMVTLGPGLEIVLPLGRAGRLYTRGDLDYLYFVRAESQRRLVGSAAVGTSFVGTKTSLLLDEEYAESFSRPSYQVDERTEQITEGTQLELTRKLFGWTGMLLRGSRRRTETLTTELYLGTDLARVLTYDEYLAEAELDIGLTPKTSLVTLGGLRFTRYPRDPGRDADRSLVAAGLRTDASALITGRALFGVRQYQQTAPRAPLLSGFYADVDAMWNFRPRTKIGGSYTRDIQDSIFDPASPEGTPTVAVESVGLRLVKTLTTRLDLRLFVRKSHSVTDGSVFLTVPDEGPVVSVRDDRIREAGADLGYLLRPNLRFAIVATYTDRNSSISYFGVDGLLVGFNAQFNPN